MELLYVALGLASGAMVVSGAALVLARSNAGSALRKDLLALQHQHAEVAAIADRARASAEEHAQLVVDELHKFTVRFEAMTEENEGLLATITRRRNQTAQNIAREERRTQQAEVETDQWGLPTDPNLRKLALDQMARDHLARIRGSH